MHIKGPEVEEDLKKFRREGIIAPVQFSEWIAPIMPLIRQSGASCVCEDYKLKVNQVYHVKTYPLPHVEDLFACLSGGGIFTTLHMFHIYNCHWRMSQINTYYKYTQGFLSIQPSSILDILQRQLSLMCK